MEIKVENIKKSFGKRKVLENISFGAESGKCVAILGENGSGKSTLFGILCGLIKGEGSFFCNGRDLMKEKALRSRIVGFVPQSPPLINELTARDNLRLWYSKEELERELEEGVLRMLGIHDFYKTSVNKMSGGMKKRLSIGCAVSHKPKVLFLDEPSAALDLICKESIAEYLNGFKKSGGIVVLASHDTYEIENSDDLYVLKNGILSPYTDSRSLHSLVGCLSDE
ncbi:MAG: ATP-binding cassette domain-containing protein [Ruminococcaceae bacterium]|nr:ATP-binding cassette domain-containing protein [Oscillospiraceae bacterium]